MSSNPMIENPFLAGIEEVRQSWGWFLGLGVVMTLLGVVCILADTAVTFATVLFFGCLLLFGGIVALVQAFTVRTWSGFFLYLLTALFRGFTGYLLIRYPTAGAISMTLILASLFIVSGLFRAISSGVLKFPRYGWSIFSGVISVALGILLLAQMPVSSVWFIGFAIGLDMLLDGASMVSFALAMHHLPNLFNTQPKAA
jgi:uncharacterized membrane protein HdeD (DUF308 family)